MEVMKFFNAIVFLCRRILGVKDAHASVLMTFSHREKERLTTSGLLSGENMYCNYTYCLCP